MGAVISNTGHKKAQEQPNVCSLKMVEIMSQDVSRIARRQGGSFLTLTGEGCSRQDPPQVGDWPVISQQTQASLTGSLVAAAGLNLNCAMQPLFWQPSTPDTWDLKHAASVALHSFFANSWPKADV